METRKPTVNKHHELSSDVNVFFLFFVFFFIRVPHESLRAKISHQICTEATSYSHFMKLEPKKIFLLRDFLILLRKYMNINLCAKLDFSNFTYVRSIKKMLFKNTDHGDIFTLYNKVKNQTLMGVIWFKKLSIYHHFP